jgi:hypothetical protein
MIDELTGWKEMPGAITSTSMKKESGTARFHVGLT